jgi:hypothetical protein
MGKYGVADTPLFPTSISMAATAGVREVDDHGLDPPHPTSLL